jgi:NSS family neurotransmitter:Na+ symporter
MKFVAPFILSALFIWNIVSLFMNGGVYGAADGYSVSSNILGGWVIMGICIISGGIVKLIVKSKAKKGFDEDVRSWMRYLKMWKKGHNKPI